MTEKSKPLPLRSTLLLAVVLSAKSAICIWDRPTGTEGGEEKRKEERSSLTYLGFPSPFPCAGEWDVSHCCWLAQGSTNGCAERRAGDSMLFMLCTKKSQSFCLQAMPSSLHEASCLSSLVEEPYNHEGEMEERRTMERK